jgi:Chitobiase/beta-hexosaminidase C-terminal domain
MTSYRLEYPGLLGRIAIAVIAIILLVGLTGCPVSTPTPLITLQPPNPATCPNTVTLTDSHMPAAIYYTTDGTQPNTSVGGSTNQYTGAFQVNAPQGNAPNAIVSAVAIAPGLMVSPTATQAFSCTAVQLPPAPTFSPTPGTYACPFNVTISDTNSAAQLLLNLSTTSPTLNQNDYLGSFKSFPVSSNTTFSAYAVAFGSNPPATILFSPSPPSQAAYTCSPPPPEPYTQLVIEILSGNDGVNNSDSTVNLHVTGPAFPGSGAGFCLKANNAQCQTYRGSPTVILSPQPTDNTWPNFGDTTVFIPITPMTAAAAQSYTGSFQITLTNGDPSCGNFTHEGCDNWRMQQVRATLQGPTCLPPACTQPPVPQVTLLSVIGPPNPDDDNCMVFLKAPPNATTAQFSLGGNPNLNSHIYLNGLSSENGITTTCKDNGD